MIEFFNKKYNRILNQSTISESLSDSFRYLDGGDLSPRSDAWKQGEVTWPVLEAALFDWHRGRIRKGTKVTDQDLKDVATNLFYSLPQYQNLEPPGFSNRWLKDFKARYKIHERASDKDPDAKRQTITAIDIEDLGKSLRAYEWEDIYNMNETALFWKRSPDSTLAKRSKGTRKPEKAQITVNLACNVTGSRKLQPWVVGKAHTPRCFHRSGIHVESFPMVWRYNQKAMMTAVIFEEYLRWFDDQMAGRKVCLLIDELVAHKAGLNLLDPDSPEGLQNTVVLLLPTKTTFLCQPLEQGITRLWKTYYRKRWLAYMCQEYNAKRDPMKSMNVLQAIRWVTAAWEVDVTPTMIQNGWVKSRLLRPHYNPQTNEWQQSRVQEDQMSTDTVNQMWHWTKRLEQRKRISSPMAIASFISPEDEELDDVDEKEDYSFDSIVETYSSGGVERDHETDEEDVAVAPVGGKEALRLLARLRLFEEQQEHGDQEMVSCFDMYERNIRGRHGWEL